MEKVKGISNATSYFKSVLLHEMGHAIGMLHEHAQTQSKCSISVETAALHMKVWADAGVNASSANVVGTSYDPYSIMNYCYILERNSAIAVSFSNKDIVTVNALYPKPVAQQDPSRPQIGQPQVGQPQIAPAPIAIPQGTPPQIIPPQVGQIDTALGYNCTKNQSQFDICKKNEGGNACYPKWCECKAEHRLP